MRRFALIGNPLSHSFSARYFTEKFQREGVDAEYVLLPMSSVAGIREVIQRESLSGLNITIPFKSEVVPHLDDLSTEAQEIGAVNCIRVEGAKLIGHNTDAFGFREALLPFIENRVESALVLGSGGSSKAVQHVLSRLGIAFKVVSRSGQFRYENLTEKEVEKHLLIINATPLGMAPMTKNAPFVPFEAIGSRHHIFDLIYNPSETLFLKQCRERGARTKNGLKMLYLQAEQSWSIWNN